MRRMDRKVGVAMWLPNTRHVKLPGYETPYHQPDRSLPAFIAMPTMKIEMPLSIARYV